jgi:hypothetical protein
MWGEIATSQLVHKQQQAAAAERETMFRPEYIQIHV